MYPLPKTPTCPETITMNLNRRRFASLLPPLVLAGGAFAADKRRIRIGQIGTKHAHAAGKLSAVRSLPDTFELVGVVEPDERQRDSVRTKDPYREVRWLTESELLGTDGLQAVVIETDIPELVPTASRCLKAGMHIHLDKPAGESLDACREMHAIASDRGVTVQMGYMLRYNPAFQFAHQLVREGWLGEITEINGMMGKYMGDAGRQGLARFSGGGMFELACHLVDQVVSLLGPPEKVTSSLRRTFPDKDQFADNQLAVFDYPKAIATIRCNHIDPMGWSRRQFSITGTQGTFEIRPLEPPAGRLGLSRPRGDFKKGFQEVPFKKPSGRYDAEFLDLAKVIRGEKKLAWDSAHDIATHEAVLRASGVM